MGATRPQETPSCDQGTVGTLACERHGENHRVNVPRGQLAAVSVVAVVLTTLMAWPVLSAPTENIFGHALVGRHHDPFTVMRQFAGAAVAAPYLQPATDWAGRALAAVLPPIAAYNVVVLLSFPLAVVFAYLLAFEITRSTMASAIAGVAFAFSPFHVAHAAYHPHIAQIQWIPLFLLALWRCLHGFTMLRGTVLVLATGLVVLSNFYGGFIVIVLLPALVPLFWFSRSAKSEPAPRNPRDLIATSVVVVVLGVIALSAAYAAIPALFERPRDFRAQRAELFVYSARWWAHFIPPVDHVLLGSAARSVWRQHDVGGALLEQQLYLGLGFVSLAAAAFWSRLRNRTHPNLRVVPVLVVVAVIALVCSLSPEREIAGWRMVRPSAWLYQLAPMFRSYARFSVVVQLMVALLAGIGAHHLWYRGGKVARVAVVLFLSVGAVEYAPWPWRYRDVLPTSGHRWLTRQPREGLHVYDCSLLTRADQATSFLAGYPIMYANAASPDCDEPGIASRLGANGVTHVLLRSSHPGWRSLNAVATSGLRETFRSDDSLVLAVADAPSGVFVELLTGWYPRESSGAGIRRWSRGESSVTVTNRTGAPRQVEMVFGLSSFNVPRHVDVFVNGALAGTLSVSEAWADFRVGPVALMPGQTVFTLRSREPGATPYGRDATNPDTRPLAFALSSWSIGDQPPFAAPATIQVPDDHPG